MLCRFRKCTRRLACVGNVGVYEVDVEGGIAEQRKVGRPCGTAKLDQSKVVGRLGLRHAKQPHLRRLGQLPPALALEVIAQVARALVAAEAHGLVHSRSRSSRKV